MTVVIGGHHLLEPLRAIPRSHRAMPVAVVIVTILALASAPLGHPATAAAPGERLPDLAMVRPLDVRLETSSDGRRRLRFTAMIVNIGDGPFETRAARASTRRTSMLVKQRIYDSSGGYRVVPTLAVASYSGDGHDHWHVQRVAQYALYDTSGATPAVARSSKVGFCFFDTRPYRLSIPHAPAMRRYSQSGCGTRTALAVKNGISVDWADRYGWELRYQSIDVTGLPAGEYLLKVSADPNGYFVERSVTNNCNWTRVRIRESGTGVAVLDWGAGCSLPTPTPAPIPTPTPTPTPTRQPPIAPSPTNPPTLDAQPVNRGRRQGGRG